MSHLAMCVTPPDEACKEEEKGNEDVTKYEDGLLIVKVPHPNSHGDVAIRNAATKILRDYFEVSHPNEIADFLYYCLPRLVSTLFCVIGCIRFALADSNRSFLTTSLPQTLTQWCCGARSLRLCRLVAFRVQRRLLHQPGKKEKTH